MKHFKAAKLIPATLKSHPKNKNSLIGVASKGSLQIATGVQKEPKRLKNEMN